MSEIIECTSEEIDGYLYQIDLLKKNIKETRVLMWAILHEIGGQITIDELDLLNVPKNGEITEYKSLSGEYTFKAEVKK